MPAQKELVASIKVILKSADLDSLSAKQVRKQLETEFECELTEHKKFIDNTLMRLLDDTGSGSDEKELEVEKGKKEDKKRKVSSDSLDSELEPQAPIKRGNTRSAVESSCVAATPRKRNKTAANDVSSLVATSQRSCKKAASKGSKSDVKVSAELAAIIGAEILPMSEISLRLHQEVLSRQLYEDDDRRYIACDKDFKALFRQERVRASALTNLCKKHITKLEKESTNGKGKKSGMYGKKLWLSPDLANIIGYNFMSRSSVVKEMWKVIKQRGLQDPKNKRYMIIESDMMPVFKLKRVHTFGMMKYLSSHMIEEDGFFRYGKLYPDYCPEDNGESPTGS